MAQPNGYRTARSRTTLAQIAREAEVSVPTVSKVLNGHHDVAPGTRSRVQALLDEHSYVAPRGGRTTTRSTPHIELVFDEFGNPNTLEVARGAVEAARARGIGVSIAAPMDSIQSQSAGRAGVIVVMPRVNEDRWRRVHRTGVPMLFIDPHLAPADVSNIGATNFTGGVAATEHLISLGHTRIAIITGRRDSMGSQERLLGFTTAMESAGLRPDSALVRQGDFTFDVAHALALELLSANDPPTAIFASSDVQAFAVMEAARQLQIRVPQDLSIVGFDDVSLSPCTAPALTTIRQPYADMARLAVSRILEQTGRAARDGERIELATDLQVRQSTAPPNG